MEEEDRRRVVAWPLVAQVDRDAVDGAEGGGGRGPARCERLEGAVGGPERRDDDACARDEDERDGEEGVSSHDG